MPNPGNEINEQSFSLQPFPMDKPLSGLEITGKIARRSNTLVIRYALLDHLAEAVIPAAADVPARRNELWKETCFELFLSVGDSPRYWEFNLSPSGHWNIYRFENYRQGMQEETAFASLPFAVQRLPDLVSLALEADSEGIAGKGDTLKVGICTVIIHRDGELSYWALTHPGPKPDFHRRDGFTIGL